jgi:PBP1b-binding outer membrane lipoprotein LpoB
MKMKKMALILLAIVILISGCASWNESKQQIYSTNSVPLDKRAVSEYPLIIISTRGPQPSPDLYEVLGEVRSLVNNITVFEKRGKGAVEMLRNEARQVGAHAIINTQVGETQFGTSASGVAIRFKNYDETIRLLKEIGAVVL